MSVWIPPTTAQQSGLTLSGWGIFEVLLPEIGTPTVHLAGYNERDNEGRVSSALESFDAESRCGVTSSGRVYRLVGNPGLGGDASYVWSKWLNIWTATVLQEVRIDELPDILARVNEG